MKTPIFIILGLITFLVGCVPTYSLVQGSDIAVGMLQIDTTINWNRAPNVHAPYLKKGSEMWTLDGALLDRMVIIPGVADGEALIRAPGDKAAALPTFRADMLPNEIEELAESTFVKLFGEGNAAVTTENLRPNRFGEHRGVMFDVNAVVSDSPNQEGTVGAFIANERLYMIFFFAATPYYHDKHAENALSVIKSARLVNQ